MKGLLTTVLLLVSCWASVAAPPVEREDWRVIERDDVDTRQLAGVARALIDAPEFKWRHAQTEHFVLHFENGIFAAKVARMAEFFHRFIADDLGGLADRVEGRSHIFIFRNAKDWTLFLTQYHRGGLEWSFSMVQGPVMYLQQAADIGSSAEVLGHEMTHLVLNRLVEGEIPLWLNEGLAEWYGAFAYAAFKGTKRSKRAQFAGLRSTYPLPALLVATAYPEDPRQVSIFYQTAKHLVGYLQLEQPPEKFAPFLLALARGEALPSALSSHYGLSVEEWIERFDKFRR